MEGTEKVQSIKKGRDIKEVESAKKAEKVRSTISKSKSNSEEILELNSEGDIVGKEEAVKEPTLRVGHKNYVDTRQGDKSEFLGYSHRLPEAPLTTLLGKDGLKCSDDELRAQSLVAWRHHLRSQLKGDIDQTKLCPGKLTKPTLRYSCRRCRTSRTSVLSVNSHAGQSCFSGILGTP